MKLLSIFKAIAGLVLVGFSATAESDMAKHAIPDQYIVVFDETMVVNATDKALRMIRSNGTPDETKILWSYRTAFQGVTMSGVDDSMLEAFEGDPEVKYYEQDVIVYLDSYYTKYQQNDPPNWGLDRIDEMLIGLGADEEVSGFDGEYKFDQTGDGVLVFVVDTGIRADHDDFLDDDSYSRISCGFDSYHLHEHETGYEMGCIDGVGHGTHIAGIIGGSLYGVAKSVVLVSIKTFTVSGSGSVGSVMSGLDFIQRTKLLYPDQPMVANLSFGTPHFVKSLEEVIAGMVSAGVIVMVSAGNEGGDACAKWPAAFPNVITVGATTYQDEVAPYSNIGSCVDLFAPGDRITSAWNQRKFDRATISGTSAASAHAAGVAALVLEKYPAVTPEEMKKNLQTHSEMNAVQGLLDDGETPNLLLNMALLALD